MAKSKYKPNAPRRGVARIPKFFRPYGGVLAKNGRTEAENRARLKMAMRLEAERKESEKEAQDQNQDQSQDS